MTKNCINNTWKDSTTCLKKTNKKTAIIGTEFCFVLFCFPIYKGQGRKDYKIFGSLALKSTHINGRVVFKNAELYREPMHRSKYK